MLQSMVLSTLLQHCIKKGYYNQKFQYEVTPTNDTDYSCHINVVELVQPIIWGS